MFLFSLPIDTPVLVAICAALTGGAGYLWGIRVRKRRLEAELRHTNHERNELHVQSMQLRELIENQELDIKRYVAELQLYIEMQREWRNEKSKLQIALDQAAQTSTDKTEHLSHESYLLMVQLWKKEIGQLQATIEAKDAENASIKQVMQFLSAENKRLREALGAKAN